MDWVLWWEMERKYKNDVSWLAPYPFLSHKGTQFEFSVILIHLSVDNDLFFPEFTLEHLTKSILIYALWCFVIAVYLCRFAMYFGDFTTRSVIWSYIINRLNVLEKCRPQLHLWVWLGKNKVAPLGIGCIQCDVLNKMIAYLISCFS